MRRLKTTTINIKIDLGVKEEARMIADEIGLTLSGIVTAFLKHFIRTKEIRFVANDKTNPYLEGAMRQSWKDMNKYRSEPMNLDDVYE